MTNRTQPQKPLPARLLQAGIQELNRHGVQAFSVRRVAAQCGVSCAAPYKHFADKQSFIAAILEYISAEWAARQQTVLSRCPDQPAQKILELGVEYVRFLVENPQFRAIIMLNFAGADQRFRALRAKLNRQIYILVLQYCKEAGMTRQIRRRKIYVVRSLIYGAALMFDNNELEYNEENMQMVRYCLEREFSLP